MHSRSFWPRCKSTPTGPGSRPCASSLAITGADSVPSPHPHAYALQHYWVQATVRSASVLPATLLTLLN